jgi:hypothetical protein
MAATNFTPIQLYHSTTASAAPTAGNLANGELAINITDGKLFYKDNGGTVQVLATKGTGTIGGSNTQVQYNSSGALAGSSNFTFNGTTATINTLNLTNALDETYGGTGITSYTTGDLLYASASNTLSKLTVGTNGYILTSNGTIPTWTAGSSISVNTATNLAGGLAGSVPYQSGPGATTFLGIGAANRVLTSSGTAPQWVTSLTGLTGVSSSGLTNTSLTAGRVVYSTTGGAQTDSANLTFDGTTLTAAGLATGGVSTLDKLVKIGDSGFTLPAVLSATAPAKLYVSTATVTDGSSANGATNALGTITSFGSTTVAASNTGVTYTNLATLYIAGAPTAGTNITITNPYALYSAAGANYFGGNVVMNANLTVDGTTLFVDSSNNRVGFGTATPGYPVDMTSNGAVTLHVTSSQTGSSAYATARFDQADTTAYGFVGVGGASVANTGLRDSMYFGTTSANNVVLMTNDTPKLRIDSSQHATFGNNIAVSGWSNSQTSLELGYNYPSLALMSNGAGALFVNNLYFDGTNWKYSKNSDYGAIFNANDNSVGAFGWYTVALGGGSAKDTTATLVKQMSLGQNGLLTLGDSTYAWTSSVAGIDLRNYGGLSSDSSYAYLSSNIYYDGANKRKTTGGVGLFGVGNGGSGLVMQMQYAGSGAANSTISFSTAFAVDTSGNFGIKTTSMGAPLSFQDSAGDKIQFNGSNSNQYKIGLATGGTGDAIMRFTAGSSGEYPSGAGDFQFYTGTSQKFGISSKGFAVIGNYLNSWGTGIGVLEFGGSSRNQSYVAFNGSLNPKGYIYSNLYYDGSDNRYANTGTASVVEFDTTYSQWWFATSGSANATATMVGKARLNSSGYLGLNGQLNPRVPLQTGNAAGQQIALYDDNNTTPTRLGLGIDLTGGSYELSSFIGSPTGPDGKWTYSKWNSTSNSYTKVATICQNGIGLSTENPTSGVGIKFPASQSASSNVNTLDDYEEGTWTPALTGTGGGTYTMSGVNEGKYTKIGNVVTLTCTVQWSAVVSAYTGNLLVGGIPFTCSGVRCAGSMGAISAGLTFTAGYGEWNFLVDPGLSGVYIIQNSTTGAGYSHTPNVASSGLVYALTITYMTST